MVAELAPGSVIVDLAVEAGGNVEGSRPGEIVDRRRTGSRSSATPTCPLASPVDASQLYARNLLTFLTLLVDKDRQLKIDTADEIIKATLLTAGRRGREPGAWRRRPRPTSQRHDAAEQRSNGRTRSLAERASASLPADADALAHNLDALAQQLATAQPTRSRPAAARPLSSS